MKASKIFALKRVAKPKPIKKRRAWALVDPETGEIECCRLYESRVTGAGRGSITEDHISIQVEIRPIVRKKRKR